MTINPTNLSAEAKRTGFSMATLQGMSQYIYGKYHAELTDFQKKHIVDLLNENVITMARMVC